MKSPTLLLYERLYFAAASFRLAHHHANFLIKKKWHFAPWEARRRWTTLAQQSAFTTALVIAYTRPFTGSKGGWPKFPSRLVPYDREELNIHSQLLEMRNEVFAHTSGRSHSARPTTLDGWGRVVTIRSVELVIPRERLHKIVLMLEKLLVRVTDECEVLGDAIDAESVQKNA